MPRLTQLTFKSAPTFERHFRKEHGGSLYQGRRKEARPIATRRPMHVVLRSSRARGTWSFLRAGHIETVDRLVRQTAARFHIKLIHSANSGNHLHLVVQSRSRKALQDFFRTLPALLARAITGARKGVPIGRFWDAPLYTRLITWGRELAALARYLFRNDLEAIGFFTRSDRSLTFAEALARRGIHLAPPRQ